MSVPPTRALLLRAVRSRERRLVRALVRALVGAPVARPGVTAANLPAS